MGVVDQWTSIENGLDPKWRDARLDFVPADDALIGRAAALLAPAGPGRMGKAIRFYTARRGGGVGPEAGRRMFKRGDEGATDLTLTLVSRVTAALEPVISRASLAAE